MVGSRTNREILTGGQQYAQKKASKYGVDEVIFDPDNRKEYLTGFHKRKLQRQKRAQDYNKEQERLARIEERKRIREERKRDLESQVQHFRETMVDISEINGGRLGSDTSNKENLSQEEEFVGFDDENDTGKDAEEVEKSDKDERQDQLRRKETYKTHRDTDGDGLTDEEETIVTVDSMENPSQPMIQSNSIKESAMANNVNLDLSQKVLDESIDRSKKYAVLCGVAKPSLKSKLRKKKFRYLSKAERRQNARKQKEKKRSKRND